MELLYSQYGVWDRVRNGEPGQMNDWLIDAYLRRRRWEMEQQAIHIVNALALALGSGKAGNGKADERKGGGTGDPLRALAAMGVKVPI